MAVSIRGASLTALPSHPLAVGLAYSFEAAWRTSFREELLRREREVKTYSSQVAQLGSGEPLRPPVEISRLRQSIRWVRDLTQKLPHAIAQGKERASQLKLQNQARRAQLQPLLAQLKIISAKGASRHGARQLKSRDNDRLIQRRLMDTRKALLAKLCEVGQPGIPLPPSGRATVTDPRQLSELRLSFTSGTSLRRARRGGSASLTTPLDFWKGYVGGAAHALHVTVVAARYLGVTLPFELECRGPSSVLHLIHHHPQYQQLSHVPLFEVEAKKEQQPVLVAMIGYNTLYLHHLQQPAGGVTTKPPTHLVPAPFSLWGPPGLPRLLAGCRPNAGRPHAGPGLDPTFDVDFNQVVKFIRGGHPQPVHDDHFPPDPQLQSSWFRDEDYDLGFTKSQLPPPEALTPYHPVALESEEESYEFVDCVLPPTPSELSAAGI
ncbi:hypothetical protein L0F63_000826 [Massospora cicadina]|nr:hypothetical protein L0F63_000826 [Massospora cicadina]